MMCMSIGEILQLALQFLSNNSGAILVVIAILGCILAWLKYFRPKKVIHYHTHKHKHEHRHVVVRKMPTSDEKAKRIHKIDKIGYVREDQADSYKLIASPEDEYQKLLLKLKPYLNEKDMDILIATAAVIKAQKDRKYKESEILHKKLKLKFGSRGSRFYDLASGNLFHERLMPFAKNLDKQYGDNIHHKKITFDGYFHEFIEKTEDRIWVSYSPLTKDKIKQRMDKYKLNELWLLRSLEDKRSLKNVENFLRLFISENKNFSLEISRIYRVRNKFGQTFKIKRVNSS